VGEAVLIEAVTRMGASQYRVTGRGFTVESRVTGEGMAVERVAFRSGTELEVTVAGENELTGRVFRVGEAEFVYAVPGVASVDLGALLPTQLFSSIGIGRIPTALGGGLGVILENPHAEAVQVTAEAFDLLSAFNGRKFVELPALGRLEVLNMSTFGFSAMGSGGLLSSLPIRAAFVRPSTGLLFPVSTNYSAFRLPDRPFSMPLRPVVFRQSGLQTISFGPAAKTFEAIPVVVTTTERWLTATVERQDARGVTLSVRVDAGGMAPGNYTGSIVVTPSDTTYQPQTISVRLEVRAAEFIRLSTNSIRFASAPEGPIAGPAAFTVRAWESTTVPITLRTETEDGGRWLTVSTSATTTPSQPDVQANPTGLKPGTYRGRIVVRGPINQEEVAVTFVVAVPTPLRLEFSGPKVLSLSFPLGGSIIAPSVYFPVAPRVGPVILEVVTESGGNWLRAESDGSGSLTVVVDPRVLGVGNYRGTVRVRAPMAVNTLELPVTVRIWSGETEPLVVTPAALSLAGRQSGTLVVTSSGGGLDTRATVEKQPDGCELSAVGIRPSGGSQFVTPAEFSVWCIGPPGRYEGSIRITAGSRSVVVPVSVVIPPVAYSGLASPAVVNTVTNGASNRVGAVAAGQYVTLHGVGRDRRVTFDELPARVLFESLFQTNVVVPDAVRGRKATTIRVGTGEAVTVAVETAAPGLFTGDGTGVGQGAILNQDNEVNSAARPAARGSIVQIFGTGEGTAQEVWVTIGGVEAAVVYAGSTQPGLFQVNAVIPEGAASGAAVPVTLRMGEFRAQVGVTMAVR